MLRNEGGDRADRRGTVRRGERMKMQIRQEMNAQAAPFRYQTASFSRRCYVARPFMAAWGLLPQTASRSTKLLLCKPLSDTRSPKRLSSRPFAIRFYGLNQHPKRFVHECRNQLLPVWPRPDPTPLGDESLGYVTAPHLWGSACVGDSVEKPT